MLLLSQYKIDFSLLGSHATPFSDENCPSSSLFLALIAYNSRSTQFEQNALRENN